MEDVFQDICDRLKIIAVDVDRVQRAKELLSSLQRHKAFLNLLGEDDEVSINPNVEDMKRLTSVHSLRMQSFVMKLECSTEEDIGEEMSEDICNLPFDEERWGNHFTGFQILNTTHSFEGSENGKCIQLDPIECDQDLHQHLLSGVRCFMLDLFRGTLRECQELIVQLREAEINVSKEFGFPVVSTIFAKLSPRQQYTGYLKSNYPVSMEKGFKVVLTVDRSYSRQCTSHQIYVNARFLITDVRPFDIILIGEEIQLMVRSVHYDRLNCCVCRGGSLLSFMPVLFPARCAKNRISYEEVEDLTFAREVGLNVVVSFIPGTVEYVNNLESIMQSLECTNLRLFARVVLNEIQGCDGELNWIADRYDGFLMELAEPAIVPDILHLCPNAECLMQLAYEAKKPIIFNALQISEQRLRVDPAHYYYTFYFPDKYLVKGNQAQHFYFNFLQTAIFNQITPLTLSKMPHCDKSHTGADGLARAIVIASIESDAKAIVICGVTTRMAQKISHYRPKAPILFISHMRSAEDYVSLYYNVTMLPFRSTVFGNHPRNIYRKAIFGLAYLASRKLITQGQNLILVFNHAAGTTFPEKYIIYKFDKLHFVKHMGISLFANDLLISEISAMKE